MTVSEQLEELLPCLRSLEELLPRGKITLPGDKVEPFPDWIQRGLESGLLTHKEYDGLQRIFVYDNPGLEWRLSLFQSNGINHPDLYKP